MTKVLRAVSLVGIIVSANILSDIFIIEKLTSTTIVNFHGIVFLFFFSLICYVASSCAKGGE